MIIKKIRIASVSFVAILAVLVFPSLALGDLKANVDKEIGVVQEKNQGKEKSVQNQVTEEAAVGQSEDKGKTNNENGGNAAGFQGESKDKSQGSEVESGKNGQNEQAQEKGQIRAEKGQEKGAVRRNRVSNAVQEMLKVAERNGGIGQQIRNVAQNQNQEQEEAENALRNAQKRNGLVKFFIGPDYRKLKVVEKHLEKQNNRLQELKNLHTQLENSGDAEIIKQQIQVMEEVRIELANEAEKEKRGFSLFGWLNKWLSK